MSELMLRALLAGSGVGALAAMLGCFVVWRRMSYVGDAMGHAALTGVVLGLLAGVNTLFTVLATAALVGLLLVRMHRDKRLPFDALLAVVSTGGLSIGLSLFALLPNKQVDLYGYLFGDVLAVSPSQLWLLYGLLIGQSILLVWQWKPLLRVMAHEEIARVDGIPVERLQLMMTVLIAVTVALALQVVGMLLITALLVIPPLVGRLLATTPKQMVCIATGAGVASGILGIAISYQYNLATGPSIVLAALALFLAAFVLGGFKR